MQNKPGTTQHDDLAAIRVAIDSIDEQILALLNRRSECSLAVKRVKAHSDSPVYQPERERALMEKLQAANSGPMKPEQLATIYREILSASRALQKKERIACLGPEGTFSHMAGLEFFGNSAELCLQPHLNDVFFAVASGDCQLGVVPIENSLNGTVGASVDAFARYETCIVAEWYSRIHHSLLSAEEQLEDIRVVYSHGQPLGQCSDWLQTHLPKAQLIPLESTSAAARRVRDEAGSAAIAHQSHAPRYGLNLLAAAIEDSPNNWTRFFAVRSPASGPAVTDADKTSILFFLPDKPGSLTAVLQCFADAGINLSKLESRPMPGEAWKYMFFADLQGEPAEQTHRAAMEKARSLCSSLRVLGSYRAGTRLCPSE